MVAIDLRLRVITVEIITRHHHLLQFSSFVSFLHSSSSSSVSPLSFGSLQIPSIHLISALDRACQSIKHHSSSITTTAMSSLCLIESLRDARDSIESFLSSIDTDEPMLDEREGVEKGGEEEMINRDDVNDVEEGIREFLIEGRKRRRKRSVPASWSAGRVVEEDDDEVLRIGALIARRRDAVELVFQFHG